MQRNQRRSVEAIVPLVMLSEALQRNAKDQVRLSSISGCCFGSRQKEVWDFSLRSE